MKIEKKDENEKGEFLNNNVFFCLYICACVCSCCCLMVFDKCRLNS